MEFRLLGSLEVAERDRSLVLGGGKQRAVLADLLLHANAVVPVERLIDDLWGASPPATVAKSVQVYVSRLRKVLGEGRLVTRSPGYVLRVDPSELDVARFEALVGEARGAAPEVAAVRLREALALWRGPPLADLAYEPFARAEIARLEELRLVALELRFDAELATGRHAELVGELEALVAEHPLREGLHRRLMLALYRSGRQAEALEVYRRTRRVLVEELGVEPGRALQELERAILTQDPALDLPSGPTAPAAGTAVFVGRERELQRLGAALADAFAGRGAIALVQGEPGIGKSRLAEELVRDAQARGARVLVGRCWEAGGAPAYWPWVQALRTYIRDDEPDTLRARLGAGGAELARLLPELSPVVRESAAADDDGARFRLFEAVSAFLRLAAEREPLVVVLDDLHAADEPSLLLLRFLAREIAGSRVLVVGAFRDVDPTMRNPLSAAVAALVREPGTLQLALRGLSEPDSTRYIELATGTQPSSHLARAIHAETEGNPLFVSEVVRMLDAELLLSQPDAHLRIPEGVRAVIGQRVERLSAPCRGLLVPACVLGREFELDVLERLGGLPRGELFDALDEAMSERVIGDVPGSPGRLRFGHALIRDTLYDGLTAARRMQLHLRAGEALETVHAGDPDPHLAELALHFDAAGRVDEAIAYYRRAGDHAAGQFAYEEAVRLYEMALGLVESPAVRCELLLALGDAQARAGDTPASKRAFREAAEIADARGLAEPFARAALGYGGRIIWDVSRDDEHLRRLLERALELLGGEDSPLRVRLLARLAGGPLRDASFAPAHRNALSEEALAAARRLGDPVTLGYAIQGVIQAQHSPRNTRRQLELATELVEVATRAGDRERRFEGHEERFDALFEFGELDAARSELDTMERVAHELRQPSQEWLVGVYRGMLALLEGRFADAEGLISATHERGGRAQSWNATVCYRLQLCHLRREQGRLAEVRSLARRSIDEFPTYPIWRCVWAQMAAELGETAEASGVLEHLAAERFQALPLDEEWIASVVLLADAAATLGDVASAAVLHELLLPYADRVVMSYPEVSLGAVSRYLGLAAATAGRWDDAMHSFETALRLNERIGARPWLARTRHDYARALLARGAPGDGGRARALLAQARDAYRALGMDVHAARAAAAR
jgi:DNA-binding SARP family transcriptional activator